MFAFIHIYSLGDKPWEWKKYTETKIIISPKFEKQKKHKKLINYALVYNDDQTLYIWVGYAYQHTSGLSVYTRQRNDRKKTTIFGAYLCSKWFEHIYTLMRDSYTWFGSRFKRFLLLPTLSTLSTKWFIYLLLLLLCSTLLFSRHFALFLVD